MVTLLTLEAGYLYELVSTVLKPWLLVRFRLRVMTYLLFFFSSRRRHTRCLSDWSSDVCSSDLPIKPLRLAARTDSDTSVSVMDYFKEWLADLGIDSEVETYQSNKLTSVILDGDYDTFEWGWYVEPDPDSMLSYLTCGQLGDWSDTWYCNKAYDDLYDAQHVEMDDAKRQDMVKQMQEMIYQDAPYLITTYSSIGEAFRSDRFACFQPQPDPGGVW